MTVRMRVRDAGRIESAFYADAQAGQGHMRIPAVPPRWEHGTLRVIRNPSLVAVAPGSERDFADLARLFPTLKDFALDDVRCGDELDRLAHSILVLDVRGALGDRVLATAAALGLPALVPADRDPAWWPALAGIGSPLVTARLLFTDLAFAARISADALRSGSQSVDLDELCAGIRRAAMLRRARAAAALTAVAT